MKEIKLTARGQKIYDDHKAKVEAMKAKEAADKAKDDKDKEGDQ